MQAGLAAVFAFFFEDLSGGVGGLLGVGQPLRPPPRLEVVEVVERGEEHRFFTWPEAVELVFSQAGGPGEGGGGRAGVAEVGKRPGEDGDQFGAALIASVGAGHGGSPSKQADSKKTLAKP